jgi:glutamate/tyrosine decarboxylase-like PLP-dependent enzyme
MMNDAPSLAELEARIADLSLELDPQLMREAGYRAVDWIVQRQTALRGSTLGRELGRDETEALLREPMPEEGQDLHQVLDLFQSKVAPNVIDVDHPRFFGFIPSAPTFVSMLADALVAGSNVFAGTWFESSGPSQVEIVVIDWFKEMLGLPAEAAGLLVSGGSVATLTALAVARRAVLRDEIESAVVYLSDQTHASVDRALRLLNFRPHQMRRISTDSLHRLDSGTLREAVASDVRSSLRPFAVVANAGTTNTGAIDPMEEISLVAREHGLWLHVDAAYGGFAALSPRGRQPLAGIENADSVVLDPHKWFYCGYEAGCVIVRKGHLMRQTFRILPEYMTDVAREEREVNFCDYGVQLTRAFRALKVWMTIKTFGARRLREIIDQCMDLTEYARLLFSQSPRIEITSPPSLGIFSFRYIPEGGRGTATEEDLNRINASLVARAIRSRLLVLSTTRLGPRLVIRFCVLNHRTRKEDIREALRLVEDFGREASADLQ